MTEAERFDLVIGVLAAVERGDMVALAGLRPLLEARLREGRDAEIETALETLLDVLLSDVAEAAE